MYLFQWPAKSKYGRKVVLQIMFFLNPETINNIDVFSSVTCKFVQLRNVHFRLLLLKVGNGAASQGLHKIPQFLV